MSSSPKSPESSRDPLQGPVRTVGELEAMIESLGVAHQPPAPSTSDSVVGEIVDTHHPHRPGRVCVRWRDAQGTEQEHWLMYSAGTRPEVGRLVVLSRPSNWREWLVTAILCPAAEPMAHAPDPSGAQPASPGVEVLRLAEHDALRVENDQGVFMFELAQAGGQPVLRVGRDLTIALDGTFRVQAGRVEVRTGPDGTDLRSEGCTLIRSTQIRIN